MIFLIPPAAAVVFTLFYLFSDEPRMRAKIIVGGCLLAGISLQFAGGYVGTWVLGLLINTSLAIFSVLYFQAGSV